MKKVLTLIITGAVLIAVGGLGLRKFYRDRTPQPNVVLITLDTTRADHLGCYGYPRDTSPTIDRLAQRGALFNFCIAQAAVTPVSHASILTGLNPYRHGLRVCHGTSGYSLPSRVTTWAEIFHRSGYETAAFVSAFPVGKRFGLQQGFSIFNDEFEGGGEAPVDAEGRINAGRRYQNRADVTTVRAIDWLTGQQNPFFLWVHYFDPHDVLRLPPEEVLNRFPPRDESRESIMLQCYDADIYFMDLWLGRLIRSLEELGLSEDTIVVVVADHGEGLGDHNWWSHGILYQEQIHLPLIMAAPGRLLPQKVDFLVRSIDILPTILELAGIDPALRPRMEGRDLLPYLKTKDDSEGEGTEKSPQPPRLSAYADSINQLVYRRVGRVDNKNDILYALMNQDWKLIYHRLNPEESELYHLSGDPAEEKDVSKDYPREYKKLMDELTGTGTFQTRIPDEEGEVDPELRKKLRALGYTK